MEKNNYLELGPFLSMYCKDAPEKVVGVFVIDDFQSKREEFARMKHPIDFISSNYDNVLKDPDFLVESGAGYEMDVDEIAKKFDKSHYITMCYPIINDQSTLSQVESCKESKEEYRNMALEKAEQFVLILAKKPQPTKIAEAKRADDIIETKINSGISGILICDYAVFAQPVKMKIDNDLMAQGTMFPIGEVSDQKLADQIVSKRLNQYTATMSIKDGQTVNDSMRLYYTDKTGAVEEIKHLSEK